MPPTKATLKDIAEAMGVTTTTVHRALHGKEGVSDETRREVQRVATELGYRSNYMAAALKRKVIRIAIALPEPVRDSRFYYGSLWRGARRFLAEVAEFNIEPVEYAYPLTVGANGNVLRDICEETNGPIDGVLTMATDHPQSSYFIERLAEKGVPVVFVGSDLYTDKRLCTVKSYDEIAGSLAAELLTAFDTDRRPKKLIVTGHFGQLGMADQHFNVQGFEACLRKRAPHVETIRLYGDDGDTIRRDLAKTLETEPDVYAIYSSSARYTILMAEVAQQLGLTSRVKLVGSDCFEESLALLKNGTLSALVDKKIPRQGYLAMKALFDYLVKNDYPHSSVQYVRPEVVLQSNADSALAALGTFHGGTP